MAIEPSAAERDLRGRPLPSFVGAAARAPFWTGESRPSFVDDVEGSFRGSAKAVQPNRGRNFLNYFGQCLERK
jgi:hypothetical protein